MFWSATSFSNTFCANALLRFLSAFVSDMNTHTAFQRLENIGEDFEILNNTALSHVGEFDGLVEVSGRLSIENNQNLMEIGCKISFPRALSIDTTPFLFHESALHHWRKAVNNDYYSHILQCILSAERPVAFLFSSYRTICG